MDIFLQSQNRWTAWNIFRRTAARRSRRAAIRRRWILCSNEQSKLCLCPTESPTKTNLPSLTVGGFSSKVGKSDGESNITQKQKSMEKKQAKRTGRKPKTDPADYKYSFRLNAQEKSRFEKLFLESGARDRTIFIKKSIFSEQLKVIKVDKVSMDYYIRLGEFYRQFQAIGNNYNQVVRAVQKNFGDKRAMSLLYKLEKATLELILLNKQIMALTKEYEQKWLQR